MANILRIKALKTKADHLYVRSRAIMFAVSLERDWIDLMATVHLTVIAVTDHSKVSTVIDLRVAASTTTTDPKAADSIITTDLRAAVSITITDLRAVASLTITGLRVQDHIIADLRVRVARRAQGHMVIDLLREAPDQAVGIMPAVDSAAVSIRIRTMMTRTMAHVHRAANLRRPDLQAS